jgi:hypothetical protein
LHSHHFRPRTAASLPVPLIANSSGFNNIRAGSQTSQKEKADEFKLLKEDDAWMGQQKWLLQLVQFGKERSEVRMYEAQPTIIAIIAFLESFRMVGNVVPPTRCDAPNIR